MDVKKKRKHIYHLAFVMKTMHFHSAHISCLCTPPTPGLSNIQPAAQSRPAWGFNLAGWMNFEKKMNLHEVTAHVLTSNSYLTELAKYLLAQIFFVDDINNTRRVHNLLLLKIMVFAWVQLCINNIHNKRPIRMSERAHTRKFFLAAPPLSASPRRLQLGNSWRRTRCRGDSNGQSPLQLRAVMSLSD